jgi:DNA repair protein RadC
MKVYEATLQYHLVRTMNEAALNDPSKVTDYMKDAFQNEPQKEQFWVISLNRKNKPICRHCVSVGTLTSSLVHPREVFAVAIQSSAAAIIISHNHPSGDPAPSSQDRKVTRVINEAGRIMGIELIDHVIIGDSDEDPNGHGYYSFQEAGLI